jgi:hypothetical protein
VPAPEVTVSPAYVGLPNLQFDSTGKAVVQLTYTNQGLIAANDLTVNLPTNAGYIFQTPITALGTLAAGSSVVVPVTIIQVGSEAAQGLTADALKAAVTPKLTAMDGSSSSGNCGFSLSASFDYDCALNIIIPKVSVTFNLCPMSEPTDGATTGATNNSQQGEYVTNIPPSDTTFPLTTTDVGPDDQNGTDNNPQVFHNFPMLPSPVYGWLSGGPVQSPQQFVPAVCSVCEKAMLVDILSCAWSIGCSSLDGEWAPVLAILGDIVSCGAGWDSSDVKNSMGTCLSTILMDYNNFGWIGTAISCFMGLWDTVKNCFPKSDANSEASISLLMRVPLYRWRSPSSCRQRVIACSMDYSRTTKQNLDVDTSKSFR